MLTKTRVGPADLPGLPALRRAVAPNAPKPQALVHVTQGTHCHCPVCASTPPCVSSILCSLRSAVLSTCRRACPISPSVFTRSNAALSVLHPLQLAFGFGASMRILGVDIAFNLNLDSGAVPWNAVVNYLKDRLLEPLTGKAQRSSYVLACYLRQRTLLHVLWLRRHGYVHLGSRQSTYLDACVTALAWTLVYARRS